jgi:hypothetical protein
MEKAMQQATNEVTSGETRKTGADESWAEMEREKASHPKIATFLIGTCPSDTLTACANVCRFIGNAVDSIEYAGMPVGRDSADAVSRIMDMVADVIAWEAKRAPYSRRTEAEVAEREEA